MNFKKKVPESIGIFGASGHVGNPMAHWLRYNAPQIKLRLITSSEASAAHLKAEFPGCEVAIGNYFDPVSLEGAVAGLEGLYVVTPGGTDEQVAMTNLVEAVKASGSLIHMVRTLSAYPSPLPPKVPETLRKIGFGLEVQHPIALKILDASGLPITYLNLGASFMDNFVKPPMLSPGKVTWPDRRVPFIDPRDIGEAVARLLVNDNARHIGQFHTLNNGHDNIYISEAVQILREVLLMDIEYDSSQESFNTAFAPAVAFGAPKELPEYLWNFFRYEDANDVAWSLNDCLETLLGRKPVTVRSWIQEHRQILGQLLGKEG